MLLICYLPALATQLGFELPQTEVGRRCFWTTFSQQLLYRRNRKGELLFDPEKWHQIGGRTSTEKLEPTVTRSDFNVEEDNGDNG